LRRVLEVRDLCVGMGAARGWRALSGEVLASVGEIFATGESGREDTLATAMLRLAWEWRITGANIARGRELARMDAVELRRVRGSAVSIIFRSHRWLCTTIRWGQIGEVLRAHGTRNKRERRERVRRSWRISRDIERIFSSYRMS